MLFVEFIYVRDVVSTAKHLWERIYKHAYLRTTIALHSPSGRFVYPGNESRRGEEYVSLRETKGSRHRLPQAPDNAPVVAEVLRTKYRVNLTDDRLETKFC